MAEGEVKELRAHAKSYDRFIFMMKWGTLVSLITALIVILLIAN